MTIGHAHRAGEANAELAAELVGGLYDLGARHAVISPGSRNTPSVLALHAASLHWPDFQVHVIVDERAAGFFALGLCRATSAPVILSCSSGSAGAHYHPAFVEADESSLPLVAITADRPAELHGRSAPQTIAQHAMLAPHARISRTLPAPSPESARALARSGLSDIRRVLLSTSGGPVHLNVQAQEPLWPHTWETRNFVALIDEREAHPYRNTPSQRAPVDEPVRSICSVERGLIVVGPMDSSRFRETDDVDVFREEVRQLSEGLGYPVLADPCSQLRTSGADHVIGCYDIMLRSDLFCEIAAPEVVIALGDWPTSKVLGQFIERYAPHVVSVQEDHGLRDPWDVVSMELCLGYDSLRDLLPTEASSRSPEWSSLWQRANAVVTGAFEEVEESALWEGTITQEIAASLTPGTAIHVGSSMPIRNLDAFLEEAPEDCVVYCSRGANGIDGTIATAAGEAAGSGRNVLAWMGDLTFLHDASSLGWISEDIPLSIVVTDNGGGGIFEHLPIAANTDVFEEFFITPPTASVAEVARGYGWDVKVVSTANELRESLTEGRGRRRVTVAKIDREENVKRYRAFWQAATVKLEKMLRRYSNQ